MRSDNAPEADEPLTDVYMPVVRGFLVALGCYYVIIACSHPFYEHGVALFTLDGLAIITGAICFGSYLALPRIRTRFWHLEAAALTVNSLMLVNVIAYQAFHFEQQKLVYFVLMSLAFATSSPSRRVAYPSIVLSLAGLIILAQQADPATRIPVRIHRPGRILRGLRHVRPHARRHRPLGGRQADRRRHDPPA